MTKVLSNEFCLRERVPSGEVEETLAVNKFLNALDEGGEGEGTFSHGAVRQGYLCKRVPIDFGVKRRIQFTSSRSFDWCMSASKPSLFSPSFGLHLAQTSSSSSAASSLASRRRKKKKTGDRSSELASLLLTWRHPSEESSAMKQRRKDVGGNTSTSTSSHRKQYTSSEQWEDWEAAFRSGYSAIRAKESPYFYFENSNCTILFLPGESKSRKKRGKKHVKTRAIFSHTTYVFRTGLKNAGIPFSEPLRRSRLDKKGKEEEEEEAADHATVMEDMKALEAAQPGGTRSLADVKYMEDDRSVRAAIVVEGREAVHMLYNHLLNTTPKRPTDARPLLLSPRPFLGANLETARIVKMCRVLVDSTQKHKLVLEGTMLPLAVADIVALMARCQGAFESVITTRGDSDNLNMLETPLEAMGCCGKKLDDYELAYPPTVSKQENLLRMRMVHGLRRVEFIAGVGYAINYATTRP
eukprot:jgi/Bigna1/78212/fgenesh1_pg.53_\